jgi:catechol 2,3-dioxygenase-like lactoylglutathione lyase family enzyme
MAALLPISTCGELDADSTAFYREVLGALGASGVPFLVGGAFALTCYTRVERQTKDLDLFIRRDDYGRARSALQAAGHEALLVHPHWLAKVHGREFFVDLIFGSGNGVCEVDDEWFRHAADARLLGLAVKIMPVEESIWSKAFIMERERYDGADIAHLLQACAEQVDWTRLLQRFGPHWRVLLSHLLLYGFVYPGERGRVPAWVVQRLLGQLRAEQAAVPPPERVCQGTLLSREQYLVDIELQGYRDARIAPFGPMTAQEVARWTDAIPGRQ